MSKMTRRNVLQGAVVAGLAAITPSETRAAGQLDAPVLVVSLSYLRPGYSPPYGVYVDIYGPNGFHRRYRTAPSVKLRFGHWPPGRYRVTAFYDDPKLHRRLSGSDMVTVTANTNVVPAQIVLR